MSKHYSILILFCCLALVAVGCAPAPEPAEEPAPVMEEEVVVEEVIPTDTPLPPTEEPVRRNGMYSFSSTRNLLGFRYC